VWIDNQKLSIAKAGMRRTWLTVLKQTAGFFRTVGAAAAALWTVTRNGDKQKKAPSMEKMTAKK
jgi:hypothetical protein